MIDAKYKSLFLWPATVVSVLLLIFAAVQAIMGGHDRLAWLGAALSSMPLPLFLLWLRVRPVERTSENLPSLLLVSATGLMIAAWEQFIEGVDAGGAVAVAILDTGIMLAYVFWYSRFGRVESGQLAVGSRLPEFTLKDADGNDLRSTDLAGAPLVLLFYRGNWCPLCMAQVREIVGRAAELDDMGINVVLVSPQPGARTKSLANSHDVSFHFLVDTDNRLAEELGIGIEHGVPLGVGGGYASRTVMPTVVASNANGTIVFSDQTDNYRVRPEPDLFLAILRRSQAIAR